jgi:hypothetical protein
MTVAILSALVLGVGGVLLFLVSEGSRFSVRPRVGERAVHSRAAAAVGAAPRAESSRVVSFKTKAAKGFSRAPREWRGKGDAA